MEKQQEKKVKKFDIESYRILAELSQSVIFEWEIESDRIYVSDNWNLIFGSKPAADNFSSNINKVFFLYPDSHDFLTPYIEKIKKKNKFLTRHYEKFELRLRVKTGKYLWFQLRLLLRCNNKGIPEYVFCMMTDINRQKEEYEHLLHQAHNDVLTGLFNKATTQKFITNYLKNARLKDKKQALFIIDIDGFKAVNDHFGHLFGDAVIAELAHHIKDSFRKTDIVGRVGGDEFMVLLKNISDNNIISDKAQELIGQLQREYNAKEEIYKISASVGIAVSPESGIEFEELFEKADRALYHVKAEGKNNYYIYHDKMPVSEYVNNRINSELQEKNQKSFYENVIEYIFRILYRSEDADAATNLILEVIGRRYSISRTFILEKKKNQMYANTFEWCNDGVQSQQGKQQHILSMVAEKFFHYFDENGVFSCENVTLLPQELRRYFNNSPVKALLECAMVDKGNLVGLIGFEYHPHPRAWKNEEIEALSFTAEILGTFLLHRRSMDEVKLSRMQALEILDHIESFIYVIDKNTREILFLNESAAEFFGTDKIGKHCYDSVCCESMNCSFCPAVLLTEVVKSAKQDIYIPKRKIWLHVSVSKIQWDGDRDVCMVHCHDITAIKKGELGN